MTYRDVEKVLPFSCPSPKFVLLEFPGLALCGLKLLRKLSVSLEWNRYMLTREQVGKTVMDKKTPKNVNEYISGFPEDVRAKLEMMRATILEASPEAEEKISYQIPTYVLEGNLVHFAAYKKHIGFYPTSSGVEKFKEKLSAYKTAKGSIQFPIDEPIPYELVKEIVEFRVKENTDKAEAKRRKKN
jgi:uncharacterized protein YdhG (YjbR/CyaY superfamily)